MTTVAGQSQAGRELHLPRPRDGPASDERLLKRAARLAGVANAVGSMDLKAVADTYKREGCSGIEAAGLAAAALGAALKASLAGKGAVDPAACAEAAQLEVRKAATRKAREAKVEAVREARLAEDGPLGQARAEATRQAQAARATRALEEKGDRLADDAAAKRAMREERQFAAASRRTLSEARARFGKNLGRPIASDDVDSPHSAPGILVDIPAVRRAKALCSGAAQVVAMLEEQNQGLRNRSSSMPQAARPHESQRTQLPPRPAPGPADDEALIARAKELLADYKPAEHQRRPAVPSASTRAPSARRSAPPSHEGSPKGGRSASSQQHTAEVSMEINSKSHARRR
eukprot:TRINITY_DN107919_c0_g1_i1.p1 TRINITY_DN107919_c0_g1~~TRINITY_DN107919_c0_g1_i1.p1  ORF type:complete len:346 (-),score=72.01 TRINITY_DN107919_c0_g1_i1:45-1082(-)